MITISVAGGPEVRTNTTDDYHYMKDTLHAALETGEFGSKYPLFMQRFEDDEWEVDELEGLQQELEAIIEAVKGMDPRPIDPNWASKAGRAKPQPKNLYEVFVDKNGKPILGGVLDVCKAAREKGKPIRIG